MWLVVVSPQWMSRRCHFAIGVSQILYVTYICPLPSQPMRYREIGNQQSQESRFQNACLLPLLRCNITIASREHIASEILPHHMPSFTHIFRLKHDLSLRQVSLQIHRRSQHFSYRYRIAETYKAPHHVASCHVTPLMSSAVPGPTADVMLMSPAKERLASAKMHLRRPGFKF